MFLRLSVAGRQPKRAWTAWHWIFKAFSATKRGSATPSGQLGRMNFQNKLGPHRSEESQSNFLHLGRCRSHEPRSMKQSEAIRMHLGTLGLLAMSGLML